jgi:hypothetical protein
MGAPEPQTPENETVSSLFGSEGRRIAGLIVAVIAPATLLTALAYYFGYRRERAFAGFFGIDTSVLAFSTSDYVLRSVDALFVPVIVVLLVAFGLVFLHALAGDRLERVDVAPFAAAAGVVALAFGIALLAGHPIAHEYGYLQALGPAVGVTLLIYALVRRRAASRHALAWAASIGIAVVLVSLFWVTSEYADTRGRQEAERLAKDLRLDPSVTVFSKQRLNIDPSAPGSGNDKGCESLTAHHATAGAYPYLYSGFTLLVKSGDKYFLTPTPPSGPWQPGLADVYVIPDDDNVRIQVARGADYVVNPVEETAKRQLAFTC